MVVVGGLTTVEHGSRARIGAHLIDVGAGEDAAYKRAESDAFKRAAMAYGMGLDHLYIQTGEAKRNMNGRRTTKQAVTPAPSQTEDSRRS